MDKATSRTIVVCAVIISATILVAKYIDISKTQKESPSASPRQAEPAKTQDNKPQTAPSGSSGLNYALPVLSVSTSTKSTSSGQYDVVCEYNKAEECDLWASLSGGGQQLLRGFSSGVVEQADREGSAMIRWKISFVETKKIDKIYAVSRLGSTETGKSTESIPLSPSNN